LLHKITRSLEPGQILLINDLSKLALLAKHNHNDQVKEDEMGRACSTNEGEEESI
jgi:hypothetical protein